MISQIQHVMTLANSIIGVSVLAMPFCFKQCGIVLAVLVLLLCSILSRLACHFLVKSAVITRRRNFELLAFHAFGHMGKFLVELFIIGFLLGTCIAYFVVVGDLGPQIISKIINKASGDIRSSLLIITSVFIVLPLGLLRNIDSLSTICTATIVFYLCLVLKVMGESTQHIFTGDWYDKINYWRPAGILQCLPIFSMALFCQTQLFEIYETIPNVSLEKMNDVVRGALNICTIVYVFVGFFGYIAFCTQSFTGNILLSFEPGITSEVIKMGFVFSVAFSFPLVIFPCRASLNSLLFRRVHNHESSINYLPEVRFRCLTIIIVGISLIIGILMPNIEFVLGIVGSTIGVIICLIFPAVFFISISSKNTNERLLAQGILIIGVWIMILGTYANLYAIEDTTNVKVLATGKPLGQINNPPLGIIKNELHMMPDNVPVSLGFNSKIKEKINKLSETNALDQDLEVKDIRQEPPIPVERVIVAEKSSIGKSNEKIVTDTHLPETKEIVETIKTVNEDPNRRLQVDINTDIAKRDESVTLKAEEKIKIIEEKERSADSQKNDNLINLDAIKKEESELAADGDIANARAAERHEQLRKTLEKHKLEQRQMMQEQKKILEDIKEQKQEFEREKQRMAKKEMFRKTGKKVQINTREDTLPEIKNNVKKSVKIVENNKIDIEKSINNNELFPNKEGTNKTKINKEIQTPNENNDVNVIVESKNVVQENLENTLDKSLMETVNHETSEKTLLYKNVKVKKIELNNSDDMKGPILNVLSKGILQRFIEEEEVAKEKDNLQTKENGEVSTNKLINDSNNVREKYDNSRYSVPIALKMTNHTKISNIAMLSLNESESVVYGVHRDILENTEQREKRDISAEINVNETKDYIGNKSEKLASLAKNLNASYHETCSKLLENAAKSETEEGSEKNIIKSSITTKTPLIKTNVYLYDQEITKTNSMNLHGAIAAEYVNMEQRNLKVLDRKSNIEI